MPTFLEVSSVKIEKREIGSSIIYSLPVRGVKTLSLAFAIPAGSAHEPKDLAGAAHLLEHVVFKGTKNYEEYALKYELEVVGGSVNAFTTKDFTVYYTRVPYSHYEKAIEILCELVFNPLIEESKVELEKSVVIEEIKSFNEDYISRVHDLFSETLLEEPYNRPVSGYEKTVAKLNSKILRNFHSQNYGNLRVVAVGKVTKSFFEKLEKSLRQFDKAVEEKDRVISFKPVSRVFEEKNDLTQIHTVVGLPIDLGVESKQYSAFLVLNTLLGSGMSSLLFNRIREKHGLVYDIDLVSNAWKDRSLIGIYASTSTEKFERYTQEINKIFNEASISKDYFEYGKKRLIGKLQMVTESIPAIFSYILEFLITKVEPFELNTLLKAVESVSHKDVQSLWHQLCTSKWHWSCLIPKGSEELVKGL